MTATASANATFALARAAAGHPVFPLCAVVEGRCGFPHHCDGAWDKALKRHVPHEGRDIGKAPQGRLAPNGVKDATTNLEKVRDWWLQRPLANGGEPLEPNGWLLVDPDSPAAQAEAHKLGLFPTLTRHSRSDAYLYRRPDDCPIGSLTNKGDSGELDVKTSGYVVTFGTHANGQQIELVGDEAAPSPSWAVEWLKGGAEAGARRKAAKAARTDTDDEPPVRLDDEGMATWRGERPKRKPGGTMDRNASLLKIGRVLINANATRRTIVAALAERDVSLGWRKFTGRGDADERYQAMVDELEAPDERGASLEGEIVPDDAGARGPETWPTLSAVEPGPANGHCIAHCTRHFPAERRLEQIKAILANPGLADGPKIVGIVAILEVERRDGWKPTRLEEQVGLPPDFRVISQERLAAAAAKSTDAVGRGLKTLSEARVLEYRVAGLPAGRPDVLTGEILNRPQRFGAIRLSDGADVGLQRLATVAVEQRWGGKREPGLCPKHPFAGTVEKARRSLHCEACNAILAQSPHLAVTDATRDLPLSALPTVEVGNPQDAVTGPELVPPSEPRAVSTAERRGRVAEMAAEQDAQFAADLAAELGRRQAAEAATAETARRFDALYARGRPEREDVADFTAPPAEERCRAPRCPDRKLNRLLDFCYRHGATG
jgi:hypothetical protein